MIEKTIFPREEKAEVLFDKILSDKWAYNKLFRHSVIIYFAMTILVLIFRHYNLPRHYLTATLTRIYLHFLWL